MELMYRIQVHLNILIGISGGLSCRVLSRLSVLDHQVIYNSMSRYIHCKFRSMKFILMVSGGGWWGLEGLESPNFQMRRAELLQ